MTEIGEIPEEWEVVKLWDVLKSTKNGLTYRQAKQGKYPITRIETISDGVIDANKLGYLDNLSDEEIREYTLEVGDILFSHINSIKHIAKAAIYLGKPKLLIHGMNLLLLRPNKEKVDPMFLLFYLKYEETRNRFRSWAKKAVNQASINQSELNAFLIPLLPFAEQQKIASILSNVDEALQKTDEIIQKTRELKKGLMQQLLTKGIGHTKFKQTEIGEIPVSWEVEPLEKVCATIVDCPHSTPKFTEGGMLIIRNFNIREGELDLKSTYFTTEEEWIKRTKRCIPKNGDVLFSREAPIGEACLAPENTQFSLGQRTMSFRPSEKLLNSQYLVYAIYSSLVRRQLQNLEAGVTAHHVNVADIRRLKMPIPKLDEQHKIASILSTIAEKARKERQRKEQLEKLKKGLMQDLLTGRVRVKVD
jgi:type I restriction enzyme S subunit